MWCRIGDNSAIACDSSCYCAMSDSIRRSSGISIAAAVAVQQHQEKHWQQHCSQLYHVPSDGIRSGKALLTTLKTENNNYKFKMTINWWQSMTETGSCIRTAAESWAERHWGPWHHDSCFHVEKAINSIRWNQFFKMKGNYQLAVTRRTISWRQQSTNGNMWQ